MLAFKIGGSVSLPAMHDFEQPALKPPKSTANPATIAKGENLYQRYCAACHGDVGISGGVLPDLRYSSTLANDQWFAIVLRGMLKQNGMVSFAKELTPQDAANIRAYVVSRADQSLVEEKAQKN